MSTSRYRVGFGFRCPASYVILVPSSDGSLSWGSTVAVDAALLRAELLEAGIDISREVIEATLEDVHNASAALMTIARWAGVFGVPVFWKDDDGTRRLIIVERSGLNRIEEGASC